MKTIVLGTIAIIILFFANLAWGSVNIPWQDVGAIISGSQTDETYRYILLESRLPAAIAALLSGAALATSGLLLQTAFRNPLAGPDVFGISSGAGLAVAIVMLAFGGNIALDDLGGGFLGEVQSVFQFLRNHFLCLFDFSFSHSQRIEMGMIKLLLVSKLSV